MPYFKTERPRAITGANAANAIRAQVNAEMGQAVVATDYELMFEKASTDLGIANEELTTTKAKLRRIQQQLYQQQLVNRTMRNPANEDREKARYLLASLQYFTRADNDAFMTRLSMFCVHMTHGNANVARRIRESGMVMQNCLNPSLSELAKVNSRKRDI